MPQVLLLARPQAEHKGIANSRYARKWQLHRHGHEHIDKEVQRGNVASAQEIVESEASVLAAVLVPDFTHVKHAGVKMFDERCC